MKIQFAHEAWRLTILNEESAPDDTLLAEYKWASLHHDVRRLPAQPEGTYDLDVLIAKDLETERVIGQLALNSGVLTLDEVGLTFFGYELLDRGKIQINEPRLWIAVPT